MLSYSSQSFATTVAVLLSCALLFSSIVGFVIPLAFRCFGFALRRRSRGRREILRSRVELEEDSYRAQKLRLSKTEDEDWETVEGYASSQQKGSGSSDESDWDGIIGFFHPFW